MKKLLCFLLCLTLIFSSVSLSFAAATDWSTSDQQNLSNAASRLYYMNQSAAYYLYNIATNTNNLYNRVTDIYNALFDDSHSIAYWTSAISSWMTPIYTAITAVPTDLSIIQGLLGYPTTSNGVTTWNPYLKGISDVLINFGYGKNANNPWTVEQAIRYAHYNLLRSPWGTLAGGYNLPRINGNGTFANENAFWQYGSPLGNLALMLMTLNYNFANSYTNRWTADLTGYNSTQNVLNWGSLSTSTFTPSSAIDGLYKYLASIQAPVARLSYVLANDQEIDARDAASANQDAVVDNFIDSSGDGAASPSDIGSVSDLSSGYKQNFGTDASPSGIFDIFNADHASWFSQETKNQLDTTIPSRMTKGSMSETPLLDKQIDDIYDALGVKQP